MTYKNQTPQQKVKDYFNTLESRLGYALLLKGRKHFGYYPQGKENLTNLQAQELMEDKLAEKLQLKSGSLLLDAGCGEGKVAIYLAKKYNFRTVGVDLLDWAVKNARRNEFREGVQNKTKFRVMDYTSLTIPDKTFDGIYTMETLVHVPDYRRALRQFRRVLKPKGKLALFEYSTLSLKDLKELPVELQNMYQMVIDESGMHSLPYFIHGSFPQLLEKEGFVNVKVADITPRVIPMLKKFYGYAYYPYKIIKLLGLQRQFINATSAIVSKDLLEHKAWRYNIVTATKK